MMVSGALSKTTLPELTDPVAEYSAKGTGLRNDKKKEAEADSVWIVGTCSKCSGGGGIDAPGAVCGLSELLVGHH